MFTKILGLFVAPPINELAVRLSQLERKANAMSVELDALKAAIQHDADVDAKLVAYLGALKAQLDDMAAKLAAAAAAPVIDPAEIAALAAQLSAHADATAANLPPAA